MGLFRRKPKERRERNRYRVETVGGYTPLDTYTEADLRNAPRWLPPGSKAMRVKPLADEDDTSGAAEPD